MTGKSCRENTGDILRPVNEAASNIKTGARVSGGYGYQPLESQRVSPFLSAVTALSALKHAPELAEYPPQFSQSSVQLLPRGLSSGTRRS